LGSLFGFKSRTVAKRFFSDGFGSLVSLGMVESDKPPEVFRVQCAKGA